jgi:hypothetical protein
MMTIEIWLSLALFTSAAANCFLLWFTREQSQRLSYVSQNLGDLVELLVSYKNHLKKVYSLETFYGDETLQYLLEHTRALVALLDEEYGDIVDITEPLEVIEVEELDEKSEEEKKQDVFYAGTRRGNS